MSKLPGARAVLDLALGNSDCWRDPVKVSDIEQNPGGGVAEEFARREVQNKEGLTTLYLARVLALPPHSNQNRALMVAEIDSQSDQFLRLRNPILATSHGS